VEVVQTNMIVNLIKDHSQGLI